jgi:uncharacterized protein (TIGR03492 family)
LCLSNGHGEDAIAIRILQALQQQPNPPKLAALPLVGEGRAYTQFGIPVVGPVKTMPSGGFIYMDGRQFARDLEGGLLQLTLAQFRTIRRWARQGGSILAVGDIVPLLFAWLSGAPYAFVGTAKSEYYLRDASGRLLPHQALDGIFGSVYHPWERWLMSHSRCKAVFPRDRMTTVTLSQWAIPAFDLGNPMMDGLQPPPLRQPVYSGTETGTFKLQLRSTATAIAYDPLPTRQDSFTIALLPGSRPPEAYENWQCILQAVSGVVDTLISQSLVFLAAIAPGLQVESLQKELIAQGWQPTTLSSSHRPVHESLYDFPDQQALWFIQGRATLILTQQAFADCLHRSDCAIAMAGTATEQFVGLGKPAITMPGKGPQFTPSFAEAQTRLLGASILLVPDPAQVAPALRDLLHDPERLRQIAENGRLRMGEAGAANRIAACLIQQLNQQ